MLLCGSLKQYTSRWIQLTTVISKLQIILSSRGSGVRRHSDGGLRFFGRCRKTVLLDIILHVLGVFFSLTLQVRLLLSVRRMAITEKETKKSDPTRRGGDLFIVDNSDTDWKVRDYLREWSEISHTFDIATGGLEIGALLALDGHWQKLDKIRILMGNEVTKRTKKALLA